MSRRIPPTTRRFALLAAVATVTAGGAAALPVASAAPAAANPLRLLQHSDRVGRLPAAASRPAASRPASGGYIEHRLRLPKASFSENPSGHRWVAIASAAAGKLYRVDLASGAATVVQPPAQAGVDATVSGVDDAGRPFGTAPEGDNYEEVWRETRTGFQATSEVTLLGLDGQGDLALSSSSGSFSLWPVGAPQPTPTEGNADTWPFQPIGATEIVSSQSDGNGVEHAVVISTSHPTQVLLPAQAGQPDCASLGTGGNGQVVVGVTTVVTDGTCSTSTVPFVLQRRTGEVHDLPLAGGTVFQVRDGVVAGVDANNSPFLWSALAGVVRPPLAHSERIGQLQLLDDGALLVGRTAQSGTSDTVSIAAPPGRLSLGRRGRRLSGSFHAMSIAGPIAIGHLLLQVMARTAGTHRWRLVRRVRTSATGRFAFDVEPQQVTAYDVRFPGLRSGMVRPARSSTVRP